MNGNKKLSRDELPNWEILALIYFNQEGGLFPRSRLWELCEAGSPYLTLVHELAQLLSQFLAVLSPREFIRIKSWAVTWR